MAKATCNFCNKETNSAAIDHDQDGKCLLSFEAGKGYVKGCGYETADETYKKFADDIINGN